MAKNLFLGASPSGLGDRVLPGSAMLRSPSLLRDCQSKMDRHLPDHLRNLPSTYYN